MKKLLTVKEAAEDLGITERAVWQRIAKGELPHRRWTSKVVIVAAELEQFIAALPGLSVDQATARIERRRA